MSYSLTVSIVPRNHGELITHAAARGGATGGTIFLGTGTASSNILSLLGFGSAAKDIAFVLVPSEIKQQVLEEIKKETDQKKPHFGVLWTINVSKLIRGGNESGGSEEMADESEYKMITFIVNKGYAEDVMAAARNAGAGGGTIINARGTAREGDEKFFGMEIVPEKDMLVVLVPSEKTDSVLEAVKTLPCLQKKGSGITFCSNAHDFTLLGNK